MQINNFDGKELMGYSDFLMTQFRALWTFLISPKEVLEQALHNEPWSTLFFCCLIIFLETGIIFFPFLPGDCLLLLLGSLLPQYGISIYEGILALTLAAFIGAGVNYLIGRLVGRSSLKFLKRYQFFNKGIKKGEEFYKKHGGKAVILSRAVGWARTFVPFLSGIFKTDFLFYTLYNFIGALLWIGTFVYLGSVAPVELITVISHWITIGFFLPLIFYVFLR